MADSDSEKVQAILQDYAETLEVLTINSKPLINDLTMAADRYKPLAPQIVSVIESRLFEVAADISVVSSVLCVSVSIGVCYSQFFHVLCVCWRTKKTANGDTWELRAKRVVCSFSCLTHTH